jgi:hypothetical protein
LLRFCCGFAAVLLRFCCGFAAAMQQAGDAAVLGMDREPPAWAGAALALVDQDVTEALLRQP